MLFESFQCLCNQYQSCQGLFKTAGCLLLPPPPFLLELLPEQVVKNGK